MMVTMDLVTLTLAALVTARVTRLITQDRITDAPRVALLRKLDEESLLAYLIVCDWCASFYVGMAVAAGGAWQGLWSWDVAPWLALAFSYVAGFLASKEGE